MRIGAIASVQQDLLVRALGLFRAQYPDVRVRIVPGVSLSLLGQVDAGEVDLAVLIRPPFALPPELGWQPLLSEPVALAVPAAMPEAPWRELLATQPFIRYDRASFGGRVVDLFLKKHASACTRPWSWTRSRPSPTWCDTAWAWRCCQGCAAWT